MELMDEGQYKCTLILPINSPLRSTIEGPCRKTFVEAQFAVALEACQKLRDIQELDENWMPLGRENLKMPKILSDLEKAKFQFSKCSKIHSFEDTDLKSRNLTLRGWVRGMLLLKFF